MVTRGFDFYKVKTVINYDHAKNMNSYTHRIGRTARANEYGDALTFLIRNQHEHILQQIQTSDHKIKEFKLDPTITIEKFRYRIDDLSRSITPLQIKNARLLEIKRQLLNNDKLQARWEDNPNEKELLINHTNLSINTSQIQKHLIKVPKYLYDPKKKEGFYY